jgi:PAS domain S-box-containing protein
VGALIVFGRGLWPGVFFGGLVLNLIAATSASLNLPVAILTALIVSAGNVGAALAGTNIALRYAKGTSAFESVQSILRFLMLAPAVSCLINASVGATTLTLAGFSSWERFPINWATWCLGDFVSVAIIGPVFLAWASKPLRRVEWTRFAEMGLLCLTLIGLALGTESLGLFGANHSGELVVLMAPLLLWAALRFGPRGTSCVLLLMWAMLVAQTSISGSVAESGRSGGSQLLVQAFTGLMGLMAFALAADVQRRTRAEEDLRLSEHRYRALFHGNPEPVWVHDQETGQILDVNEAALRQYGYSRPQFLNLTAADLQAEESEREQKVRGSLESEASRNGESLAFHRKSDGSTVPVEVSRSDVMILGRAATAVVSIDCAERVRSHKLATALAHLGQKLAGAREPRDAARAILGTAEALFGWDACSLSLVSPDLGQLQTVLELDSVKGELPNASPTPKTADAIAARLARNGPLILNGEKGKSADGSSDQRGNFGSVMGAPIRKDRRVIGLVIVQSRRSHAYTEHDLQTLTALADHCAETLDRIEVEQDNVRLDLELRHHLKELQAVFSAAPVGLAVCYDPECVRLIGNPAFDAMVGRQGGNRDKASACEYRLLKGGCELPPNAVPMARALLHGEVVVGEELQLVAKDGRSRPCFVSASPLYDDSGEVRGSLGVFVDLTTLKAAEAALEDRNERLRLAMAAGRMGTWSYDPDRRGKVHWSPELESLFGLAPGQFAGTPAAALELIWDEDRTSVIETFAAAMRGTGDYELEFRFCRPGKREPGWMLGRGRAYTNAAGRLTRLAGVCLDITGRKEIERELLELNTELEGRVHDRTAQLEAINKELEAFSYSVSHDLRAPLRSIRGFGEVLSERYAERLDATGRDFLRRVCDSCYHMDRLIEDLLKLSRVGRVEMQPQSIDLSEVTAELVDAIRKSEPQRSIEVRIAPGLNAFGDERLIRVVLENLLRNAWKFTSNQPEPTIEVGQLQEGDQPFFVRDNGAGFEMAYVGKLFGVFQRLHTTSEFPGTGIGLATVQRIIRRHGGRVWAHGEVGSGATIYFTLPPEPAKSRINQSSPEPKV